MRPGHCGRLLFTIGSSADRTAEAEISWLDRRISCHNAMDAETEEKLTCADGVMRVTIPARDYRMILVRTAERERR